MPEKLLRRSTGSEQELTCNNQVRLRHRYERPVNLSCIFARLLNHLTMSQHQQTMESARLTENVWFSIMALNMRVNGMKMVRSMEKGCKFGLMVHSMKDTGSMIRQMEEADLFMLTVMFITENGRMIRLMATDVITTLMEQSTKDTGLKTSNTDAAKKYGPTMLVTKENTKMEKNTAKANSYGLMAQPTVVTLWTTTSKERVPTHGLMAENTVELG